MNIPTFSRPNKLLNVVLLEGVHPSAEQLFRDAGFENIHYEQKTFDADQLGQLISNAHLLGIRSRTQLSANIIDCAKELRAIGCFCIGTNQVDLRSAKARGIPVFNAPYSNTRSVAELVIAELILLLRGIPEKNALAHRGEWRKSANLAREVRGKCLGIIGYGHIGSQVGILAENLGLKVIYYDVLQKLALGNAAAVGSLDKLLEKSDIVTLHVPETAQTNKLIGADQLKKMRRDSVLINASRGNVIHIDALANALKEKHLAGAAIDVFPQEPGSNEENFHSPLRGFDNVILTPHVGGSTVEAQYRIGGEVAEKLIRFNRNGSTISATNFPQVFLPEHKGTYRLLHIHKNKPGVLSSVNSVFSDTDINIEGVYLQTDNEIGYAVVDFDIKKEFDTEKLSELKNIDGTLRARIVAK